MASTTKLFHHASYPTISPDNPKNSQAGRTVLITGGATGIGFAIAKSFVQANASQVILIGRRAEVLRHAVQELKSISKLTTIHSYAYDINDATSVNTLWQNLSDAHITVDTLVLSAADTSSGEMTPLMRFLFSLQTVFGTNVFGNALIAAHFLASGSESKVRPRAILNISSFMVHSNPAPHQAAYATSKAAFAHLLQLLADEIPAKECQIINMHPGAILTEAAERDAPQAVKDSVVWDQEDLPAAFAVWASTPAAEFLHGRFVWANWDVEELMARKAEWHDPGYLKLGIQGAEFVNITTIFDIIRDNDNGRRAAEDFLGR